MIWTLRAPSKTGDRYYALNLEFHALIMALSKNERSQQLYSDFVNELHVFRRGFFNSPGNMRKSNREHRQIYDSILAGDELVARAAAEKHVQSGHQRLLTQMD
jgi:DNA-binding GntR family transcriptional regulator